MSIEFKPSKLLPMLVAIAHLLCLSALLLTAVHARGQPLRWLVWAGLATLAVLLLRSWWQRMRSGAPQLLRLDLSDPTAWRGQLQGARELCDLNLHDWTAVGPLLSLEFSDNEPKLKCRVLIASDQCSAEHWRAIRAALLWRPR